MKVYLKFKELPLDAIAVDSIGIEPYNENCFYVDLNEKNKSVENLIFFNDDSDTPELIPYNAIKFIEYGYLDLNNEFHSEDEDINWDNEETEEWKEAGKFEEYKDGVLIKTFFEEV